LRRVDRASGEVLQEVKLDQRHFGEGLALVEERLIQLTWRAGIAFVYDLDSFEVVDRYTYEGEGWGLCYDGKRLVMSDGTSRLKLRDAESFEVVGSLDVTFKGTAVRGLNELECAEGWIFANVYTTNDIVRIDPVSGEVTALIRASGLLSRDEARQADVLNGIAYDPVEGRFLLTGKLWPKLFEVRFLP
jgi:glutaminyl-peptide cyclotransferase